MQKIWQIKNDDEQKISELFALTVGFLCGCYSSIFIAGPLWLTLRNLGKK